jgi:hypothetical protein
MTFQLRWTNEAANTYDELKLAAERAKQNRGRARKSKASKQEGLFRQVVGALKKLQDNPRHPGLNSHPFSDLAHPFDASEKVWESYAQNNTPGAYRIFWCYGPARNFITIIAITTHP